jgi:hypothetical protein
MTEKGFVGSWDDAREDSEIQCGAGCVAAERALVKKLFVGEEFILKPKTAW